MEIVQGRKDRQDDGVALGPSIHNISKSTPNSVIHKYFSMLILTLIVPSMIIIVYSIFLVGIKNKLLAVDTNTTSTINTSLDRIFKLYC
ncbi:MAG TPA: hypothetical protein VFR94_12080 [Nitrososphaeraceae archaeon]|nr:hypothetical protein [Nitrososphaeraceae archaeon]